MAEHLRKSERRQAIIEAAARAFARKGYAASSLDDVAVEAEVSKVIIYRHFESKQELYRVVLDTTYAGLMEALKSTEGDDRPVFERLVAAADANPDGFKVLSYHAPREPEFASYTSILFDQSVEMTYAELAKLSDDERMRRWAAQLVPSLVGETILTWLDAGRPGTVAGVAKIIERICAAAGIHNV